MVAQLITIEIVAELEELIRKELADLRSLQLNDNPDKMIP